MAEKERQAQTQKVWSTMDGSGGVNWQQGDVLRRTVEVMVWASKRRARLNSLVDRDDVGVPLFGPPRGLFKLITCWLVGAGRRRQGRRIGGKKRLGLLCLAVASAFGIQKAGSMIIAKAPAMADPRRKW